MKKFISLLLVMCMSVSTVMFTVPAEATYGYVLGDANDDNEINTKDVLLVRRYASNIVDEKSLNIKASDVVSDDEINTRDVLKLRRAASGIDNLEGNNSDGLYKVDTITVSDKNISRYTVVISDKDERTEYAAKELTKYINKACGVVLNIITGDDTCNGYAIRYSYDKDDSYSLGKEGYRVLVSESGDVEIYCGTLRGPLYATYFLLEQFGWRFLTAGKSWNGDSFEYLYKAENADLPSGFDVTDKPFFNYRAIGMGGCTSDNFAMLRANAVDGSGSGRAKHEQGGGEGALYIHGHSFAYLMMDPSDRYHDTTLDQYSGTQPCLTSEEVFNRMYNYCIDLIEERETGGYNDVFGIDYTQISCSPNDNTDFCNCINCKRIYGIEGSIGGTLFRFVNRIAEALDEYRPGIEVFTIAHWEARKPTVMTRPNDNVIVCFRLGGCNNHSFADTDSCDKCGGNPRSKSETGNNLNNSEDTALYEAWSELTSNIYAWYCSDNLSYYIASSPNIFNMYEDFKYMAEVGTKGVYCEGSDKACYGFEGLRGYLISKMMWDPFMSEEEFNNIINEYLYIWYGDGWENIREYLELENASSDELGCFRNNFDRPWNIYNEEYFKNNYEYLRSLVEKAKEGADDNQKRRLDILLVHVDFFGLSATYESDYLNGTQTSKEKYAERYRTLWESFERFDIKMTNWSNGTHAADNFPSSKNDIYNPMNWIMKNFGGYWVWNEKTQSWV